MEYFIIPGSSVENYIALDAAYFETGYHFSIYSFVADEDVASEESQGKLLDFADKLRRCFLCEEQWFNNHLFWN